jgi:hypothetical protein
MPDYVYLLERRLSPAQRNALTLVRDTARAEGMTSFLTGGQFATSPVAIPSAILM